jgi:hypothetical protein
MSGILKSLHKPSDSENLMQTNVKISTLVQASSLAYNFI